MHIYRYTYLLGYNVYLFIHVSIDVSVWNSGNHIYVCR